MHASVVQHLEGKTFVEGVSKHEENRRASTCRFWCIYLYDTECKKYNRRDEGEDEERRKKKPQNKTKQTKKKKQKKTKQQQHSGVRPLLSVPFQVQRKVHNKVVLLSLDDIQRFLKNVAGGDEVTRAELEASDGGTVRE